MHVSAISFGTIDDSIGEGNQVNRIIIPKINRVIERNLYAAFTVFAHKTREMKSSRSSATVALLPSLFRVTVARCAVMLHHCILGNPSAVQWTISVKKKPRTTRKKSANKLNDLDFIQQFCQTFFARKQHPLNFQPYRKALTTMFAARLLRYFLSIVIRLHPLLCLDSRS